MKQFFSFFGSLLLSLSAFAAVINKGSGDLKHIDAEAKSIRSIPDTAGDNCTGGGGGISDK